MIRNLLGLHSWHPVCGEADLEPGTGAVFIVAGRDILLLRAEDGYHALDNTCPHAGSPIGAATFDGETVTCRHHFMRFDVRTGVCPDAPSWSTQTYPVRLRDGQVEVGL
jgi:3-phenylpropionate/trans-cinnamate dioxygenase ferredoxin subunit